MPGENIFDWSTVAADNAGADSLINWAEGQPRASVNNSSRSELAAHAKHRNLTNGSIVTAGTANAQTFSSGYSPAFTTVPTNMRVLLKIGPGLTNTDTATLSMDGIAASVIKDVSGNELIGLELGQNEYAEFLYNGTNWILLRKAQGVTIINNSTVINQASSTFVTGITDDHDEYLFSGTLIIPTNDAVDFWIQVSTDAGATWKTGAADYRWSGFAINDTGVSGGTGSQGDTKILVALGLVNNPNAGINFNVRLYSPANASHLTFFQIDCSYLANVASVGFITRWIGSGCYNSFTPITGVRFQMSTGTIASGTIRMYGIQK